MVHWVQYAAENLYILKYIYTGSANYIALFFCVVQLKKKQKQEAQWPWRSAWALAKQEKAGFKCLAGIKLLGK